MTLGEVRDLVSSIGGWASFEVHRDQPPVLTFYVGRANPTMVADALALRGVTFPQGRVVRWSSIGSLEGALDGGIRVRVSFERAMPAATTEEV